jgi:hypothetical protein
LQQDLKTPGKSDPRLIEAIGMMEHPIASVLTGRIRGDNIPGLATRTKARRLVGMRVKLSLVTAALLFAAALAAPAASAQGTAFQCIATSAGPGGSNLTIYVSQMIPGDASQRAAVTDAWGAFVKATYQLATLSSATCNPLSADPSIQQRVIAAEQNAWQKKGLNVVQVTWTPGQKNNSAQNANTNPYATTQPSADAAPKDKDAPAADAQAAPPPADPGPQPRTSYCYSDDKKPTVYFSDAFDTVDLPNPNAWVNGFAKFLAQKYAYKGTVKCKDGDTIFNVQGTIRDQKDALAGKQTVDTEWTYEPPAPGDPAAADAAPPAATPAPKKTHAASH